MDKKEIERKFLVKKLPENLENYEKIRIEQGYLSTTSTPTLRIRRYAQEYILTYKFKLGTEKQVASVAREVELPLEEETYYHLKTKIDGQMIEKDRYLIPLGNGFVAELDIFDGFLKGLNNVEVEFKSEEEARKFEVPVWFGEDVTFDVRYKNSQLCKLSDVAEILKR